MVMIMKKWAVIENEEVVNVILWDGESPWAAKTGQSSQSGEWRTGARNRVGVYK